MAQSVHQLENDYPKKHGNCRPAPSLSKVIFMSDVHPLQRLYDREINFKIETFWDGGFDVALGDHTNGYRATAEVRTFDDAVAWLVEQAAVHFPDMPDDGALDEDVVPTA